MKLRAVVEAVYVMAAELSPASTSQDDVAVTWEGFVGDKHAGLTMPAGSSSPYPKGAQIRNTRQVSIVSTEELAVIAENMGLPSIQADWLGANLLFSGLSGLSQLPPGARLLFPAEAALVVEEENMPCTTAGGEVARHFPPEPGLAQRFPKAAVGKRGLVAWVERPGLIRAGDEVSVYLPE